MTYGFLFHHLNLPSVITYTNGNSIEFVYDAAGMKLRKIVKVGATVQYEQSYLGGLEYRKNGTGSTRVEAVYHAEGRYLNLNAEVNNTLLWQKEYTLKDHLGNARISFTDKNANGIVDVPSDIVQENHYYPFGLNYEGAWRMNDAVARDNKYQYNSKEWNDDFGLNWYDYGFRWYDAAIGRFPSIDPLTSKNNSTSPYSYALNNPMLFIDILGLDTLRPLPNGDFDGGDLPEVVVKAKRIDNESNSDNQNGGCKDCNLECINCGGSADNNNKQGVKPQNENPVILRSQITPGSSNSSSSEEDLPNLVACLVKCIDKLWGNGYPAGIPTVIGGGIVYKSLPLVPVPGKNKDAATENTSELSKWSRKNIPGQFKDASGKTTRRWAPTLRNPASTTTSRGGFWGRWIGHIGGAAAAMDILIIGACVDNCLNSNK